MALGLHHIIFVVPLLLNASALEEAVMEEKAVVDAGLVVGQLAERHLRGCRLLLITTTRHSRMFSIVLRGTAVGNEGLVVVEARSFFSQDNTSQAHLLEGMWGDARTFCSAAILDLTADNSETHLALSLLETSGLWHRSETRVVAVGGREHVTSVLLHPGFRNTANALFLTLLDISPDASSRHATSRLRISISPELLTSDVASAYRRCLFCQEGKGDVHLIHQKNLTAMIQDPDIVFPERFQNFMGNKFRIVSVRYFPNMDYEKTTDEPGAIVRVKDSLDVRMLNAFAAKLNFTYEVHEQRERKWGIPTNGIYNGMMGELQREESDFTTIASPTPLRLQLLEYMRGYPADVIVVVSLQPSLLPENLALVRPFTGELWLVLVVSVGAWSVLLWLMQRAWSWVTGEREVSFSTTFLYVCGAFTEEPPADPSINISGQMLVGWWLVFCLVICTGYRSSLISHLTVKGKSQTLETFQDLLEQKDWNWGTERWVLSGNPLEYFSKNTDPVVKQIYNRIEIVTLEETLRKVLAGRYSIITFREYIHIIVASRFTDQLGNTPFYISKHDVSMMAAFGWAMRKGAPFHPRFCQLRSRLEDAGIIAYWKEDVVDIHAWKSRMARASEEGERLTQTEVSGQLVLGMDHVQGAFYLLLLGCGLASLSMLLERLVHNRSKNHRQP